MNELQKEFLDIVSQVRIHLELQRALGVTAVETAASAVSSSASFADQPRSKAVLEDPVAEKSGVSMPSRPGLAGLQEEMVDCTKCRLGKARNRIVFGEGNPQSPLVFISMAPGDAEDREGRPFVDAGGRLLNDIIVKGMKLRREDIYLCTFLKCRLPADGRSEPGDIEACEQFLVRQLEYIKPKVIVALGGPVAQALLKTTEDIKTLRGVWQQYRGIRLMPTLGPEHLLQNPQDKKAVWEDIKMVLAEMEQVKKG